MDSNSPSAKTNGDRPIRVLHTFYIMNRGGAETWIMNVMRRMDRAAYQFDFCVASDQKGAFDEEIRDLGGRIIPCLWNRSLLRYHRLQAQVLAENEYDVIHAHGYYFSGITLRIARRSGVAQRFAHVHTMSDGRRTTPWRIGYRHLMRHLIRRHATRVVGCSRSVMVSLLGEQWEREAGTAVVYYGIDLERFEGPAERAGVRAEFGIPAEAQVLLHVGNFAPAKNHGKLVEIFGEVHRTRPDVHLLMVGGGNLLEPTRALAQAAGLGNHAHFLGVRSDVPRLMKAADLLVMPSIREGMPVTMIEATAAGLPVVISDLPGTREANSIACRGVVVPVSAPAGEWARKVVETLAGPRPDPVESRERVGNSPFTSEASAENMLRLYREAVRPAAGWGEQAGGRTPAKKDCQCAG